MNDEPNLDELVSGALLAAYDCLSVASRSLESLSEHLDPDQSTEVLKCVARILQCQEALETTFELEDEAEEEG